MDQIQNALPFDTWFLSNPNHDSQIIVENPEECISCKGLGYTVKEGDDGYVSAKVCYNSNHPRSNIADAINATAVPNRYLQAITEPGNQPTHNKFLFLYGGNGTGKTYRGFQILIQSLQTGESQSAFYCPLYDLLEAKRRTTAVGFDDKEEKNQAEYTLKKFRGRLITSDFVIIDELGQNRATEQEDKILFEILDKRYAKNKPTILISNHGLDPKKSLNGKTIDLYIGPRTLSRLKEAMHVYMGGPDRRSKAQAVEAEVVTKEEAENFNMGEASPKLMTLDDNTHHIMTWLTRNPAFETVSTQRRKYLTIINEDGVEIDRDREQPVTHRDVWVSGDSLQLTGPVCDHEDKKLYALLVNELVKNHRDKINGLTLEMSLSSISRTLSGNSSGKSLQILKRQLDRLNRMNLSFTNQSGTKWSGPLLTTVHQKGDGRERKAIIEFNRYMIAFYKLHEYTTFNKPLVESLRGDSSAFYLFYSSHSFKKMSVTVDKCKKLLAIPENFDKKEALKRVKKAVQDLIDAKVMDPSETYVKDGKVFTCLTS